MLLNIFFLNLGRTQKSIVYKMVKLFLSTIKVNGANKN